MKDEILLHNKLGSLISNRICSSKDVPKLSSVDEIVATLDQVHQWACKLGQSEVLSKISSFLVKLSVNATVEVEKSKKKKVEKEMVITTLLTVRAMWKK